MKFLIAILFTTSIFAGNQASVATSDIIDANKFVGKWYAISSLPQFFSKSCIAQTAEYEVLSETKISVKNTCLKKKNKKSLIFGEANIVNEVTNSELTVQFYTWWARLFKIKGDYNIIKIDPNYEYVIVGSNDRKSLWIMSRRPSMDEFTYSEYVEFAKMKGFAVKDLQFSKF